MDINPYDPPSQPVQPAFRLLVLKRWSLALYLLLLGPIGIGYAIGLGNAVKAFAQQDLHVDFVAAVAMGFITGASFVAAGVVFVVYVIRLTYLRRTNSGEPASFAEP